MKRFFVGSKPLQQFKKKLITIMVDLLLLWNWFLSSSNIFEAFTWTKVTLNILDGLLRPLHRPPFIKSMTWWCVWLQTPWAARCNGFITFCIHNWIWKSLGNMGGEFAHSWPETISCDSLHGRLAAVSAKYMEFFYCVRNIDELLKALDKRTVKIMGLEREVCNKKDSSSNRRSFWHYQEIFS